MTAATPAAAKPARTASPMIPGSPAATGAGAITAASRRRSSTTIVTSTVSHAREIRDTEPSGLWPAVSAHGDD